LEELYNTKNYIPNNNYFLYRLSTVSLPHISPTSIILCSRNTYDHSKWQTTETNNVVC